MHGEEAEIPEQVVLKFYDSVRDHLQKHECFLDNVIISTILGSMQII